MTDKPALGRRYFDAHHRNEDITEEECRRLLAAKETGRVAFVSDGRVQIYPVNYVMHGGSVMFRTSPYGAIGRVIVGQAASFEVDDFDDFLQAGWSILVTGQARAADEDTLSTRDAQPEPWADGVRSLLVEVVPEQISGRRVHPG